MRQNERREAARLCDSVVARRAGADEPLQPETGGYASTAMASTMADRSCGQLMQEVMRRSMRRKDRGRPRCEAEKAERRRGRKWADARRAEIEAKAKGVPGSARQSGIRSESRAVAAAAKAEAEAAASAQQDKAKPEAEAKRQTQATDEAEAESHGANEVEKDQVVVQRQKVDAELGPSDCAARSRPAGKMSQEDCSNSRDEAAVQEIDA